MKKILLKTGGIIMISFMVQAQIGFAQSATVPGAVMSGQPRPTGGGTTMTGTTGNNGTTGTTGTTPGNNGGTRGTTTNNGGRNTTGTITPVPTPTDIPLVPSVTQQTTTTPTNSTLVCDQDKCAATVQKTMGNEIIVMSVLFIGALIGGIMWSLGLLMMKKGVVEREGRRMERQNRFHMQRMLTEEKMKAYDKYINVVMDIMKKLQDKKTLGTDEMRDYLESSVFINMHGSKHLRAMNDHIQQLIGSGKPLMTADQLHLKSELGKTIRADLI